MSGLWLLPLIALFSTVGLIVIMYKRARRSVASNMWMLMLLFFLLWTVGEFAQKWLGENSDVFKWAILCVVFTDIFPALFLIFTLVFPYVSSLYEKWKYLLILVIIGPKIAVTMITGIYGSYAPPVGWTEDFRFGYYPFILIVRHQVSSIGDWYFWFGIIHSMTLLFMGALVLIFNSIRHENEAVIHETRIVLVGFAIYVVIGASSGFLIPLLGYYPPELIGIGTLIMNIVVAYGILRGRVLLFQPTTEREGPKDYSEELAIGEFYICSIPTGIKTFTDLVERGYEGLYVGAVKPNLELTKFKRTPIVILTEAGKGLRQYGNLQYVPADELKIFKASIFTFIQSASRGVILLDNMDIILEKGWAPPREFVEFGTQMRDARAMQAVWMFGTSLKDDATIERLRDVMEYPVVKKAVLLDKVNSILGKLNIERQEVEDQLKRLGRVEPVFYYLEYGDGHLKFNEDISHFPGILTLDPTNVIRLFVQQFQSKIPPDAYQEILSELREYGISRFEFLLRSGDSYLVEETFDDRGRVYDVFLDLLDRGFSGICISRTEPNKLRQRYLLPRETEIYWLTQDRKEDMDIRPAPEYLNVNIKSFIEAHGDSPGVILLDGLEYLITFQGDQFESYLRVLRRISDYISQSRVILLIPYDPEAIPPDRVALFRRSGIDVITREMLA